MSKSHYFVAPQEDFEGMIQCSYCGRYFKPKTYNNIYCSHECYEEAHRIQKAEWFQKNKQRLNEKRNERHHKKGIRPREVANIQHQQRKTRNRVIKQGLIYLELFDNQVHLNSIQDHINYNLTRKKFHPEICEYIRGKLQELELYPDQIALTSPIDLSGEYHNSGFK